MASCVVYDEASYIVAPAISGTAPRLSAGLRRPTGLLMDRIDSHRKRTLWDYVAGVDSVMSYVERPSGWVAVAEPTEADVAAGYRILRGGYINQVTGQDLSNMVDDGALSVTEACAATVQATTVGLTDDLGNQLVTSMNQPVLTALVPGSPINLSDTP